MDGGGVIQLFEGLEGGGVTGVNATQRKVRKGKLTIHKASGRGPFGGEGEGYVHSGTANK